jgi:deoxyribodipyrimidine photo-lyase
MTATRRLVWNFALDRALEIAREGSQPLVILEALRCDYPWASARFHRFVMDGMEEHRAALSGSNVTYYPYVEPSLGAGRGLLEAMAARASVVVTDDHPGFFYPRMIAAAAARLDVTLEAVDSCGLVPVRQPGVAFVTAHSFRRRLQRSLPELLAVRPRPRPLSRPPDTGKARLPAEVRRRWAAVTAAELRGDALLDRLPIDRSVPPVPGVTGGTAAGRRVLKRFVRSGLPRYADESNRPESEATSGLSPWLHFGHLSPHEVFAAVTRAEGWTPVSLSPPADGRRRGWWGMSSDAESFLDQIVTWRELGHNAAARMPDYDRWKSLPKWARETLGAHAGDPREPVYSLERLEEAETHDPLWNAAQRQLVTGGRIHNYLRMLWGKKILEWSPTPREALAVMLHLNDKYALDGRDPNSVSGIFWILGRYDRPWGPERPIFGKIRYMSSENTARKFPVKRFIERYAG